MVLASCGWLAATSLARETAEHNPRGSVILLTTRRAAPDFLFSASSVDTSVKNRDDIIGRLCTAGPRRRGVRPAPRIAGVSAPRTSRLLSLAALVCLLEAAALVTLAGVELATLATDRLAVGVTTTTFFLVYALGLATAAVGLLRTRSWARAPLMLAQLIQLGVAWSFHGPGTDWLAVLLAVAAGFVVVVLLLPATTVALYGDGRSA